MTWIRFGRNEPQAPSLPLQSNRGDTVDLHALRVGCLLLLFFAPIEGVAGCEPLFFALVNASMNEHDAELLVVTPQEDDLVAHLDVRMVHDERDQLRARYAGLMDVDSAGKPLLFVLDRDGSPVYAWVGACGEAEKVPGEAVGKVQSAAFLCPECSVPDPASAALWDAIY